MLLLSRLDELIARVSKRPNQRPYSRAVEQRVERFNYERLIFRRSCLSHHFAPFLWRMIPGFRRDASWFNVRWRVDEGRSPLDGKQLHAVPPAKVLCGVVFNEQSGKLCTEWLRSQLGGASPDQRVEAWKSH